MRDAIAYSRGLWLRGNEGCHCILLRLSGSNTQLFFNDFLVYFFGGGSLSTIFCSCASTSSGISPGVSGCWPSSSGQCAWIFPHVNPVPVMDLLQSGLPCRTSTKAPRQCSLAESWQWQVCAIHFACRGPPVIVAIQPKEKSRRLQPTQHFFRRSVNLDKAFLEEAAAATRESSLACAPELEDGTSSLAARAEDGSG